MKIRVKCFTGGAKLEDYSSHIVRLLRTVNSMSKNVLENPTQYSPEVIDDLRDSLELFRKSTLSHGYMIEPQDFFTFQNNLTNLNALVSHEEPLLHYDQEITRASINELNQWKKDLVLHLEAFGRFGLGSPEYDRYCSYKALKDVFCLPDWEGNIPSPKIFYGAQGASCSQNKPNFSDIIPLFQNAYNQRSIRKELIGRAEGSIPSCDNFPRVVSEWRSEHMPDASLKMAVNTILEQNYIV